MQRYIKFGSSSSKSESTSTQTEASASHVTAGGNVNITTRKDINIHGSDVSGKDVNLKAGGNVNISSAEQTNTNTTNQASKGGSLGVTFGGGLPVTVSGNIYSGKENENGTGITHRGSTVTADQALTVESDKDTNILGSKAEGNKVVANIGGNLNIESQQDRNDYDSHSSSMGAGFDTGIASGHTSGSAGVSQGKMDSNYKSVTDQAGIYAGSDGFDINVKGNTDLKGAVIGSNAPAEKNKLTTGTLTWEDQQNKADYQASGAGVSYAGKDAPLNAKGLTPSIAPTVKGNADSTTKSAVAEGTVTITNTKDQKQNVSDLNRDTKNTLNKLHEIFDKDKVQEKQESIGLLTKDVNEAIHKVADKNNWADGSKEKTALHALASGILAEMSGAGFSSGALAGGVNEYVIGYLSKTKGDKWMWDHPDEVQWLSLAFGGIVNKVTGGDVSAGEAMALAGTKWNKYQYIPKIRNKIEAAKLDGSLAKLGPNEFKVFLGTDDDLNVVAVMVNREGLSWDIDEMTNDPGFMRLNKNHNVPYEGEILKLPRKNDYGTDYETDTGIIDSFRIGDANGSIYDPQYYWQPKKYDIPETYSQFLQENSPDFVKTVGIELLDRRIDIIIGQKYGVVDKLDKDLSLSDDADLYHYGYDGARKRFLINSIRNAGLIYLGGKSGWISSFIAEKEAVNFTNKIKDEIAPAISEDEAKKEIKKKQKEAEEEMINYIN